MYAGGSDPGDASEQLIVFARDGRLVSADADVRPLHRLHLVSLVLGAAFAGTAFGAAVALGWAADLHSPALGAAVVMLALIGIGLLTATALSARDRAQRATSVQVRPGAVLPPDLLRAGNWIHRAGGWVRIDEVGHEGMGRITALLSTGELITIDSPVTIAGGAFRPVKDPVEALRR
jgi:hypothetical protein